MERDPDIMNRIMEEKEKDIMGEELMPLDEEGRKLAEGKRFTFDVINTPVDPLR